MNLVLTFDGAGVGHCLYSELIDLTAIGPLTITRATQIEFDHSRQHWVVMDTAGQILFSHASRAACLDWEQQHFNQ